MKNSTAYFSDRLLRFAEEMYHLPITVNFCSLTSWEKSLPSTTHPEICTQANATAGKTPAIYRHKHLVPIALQHQLATTAKVYAAYHRKRVTVHLRKTLASYLPKNSTTYFRSCLLRMAAKMNHLPISVNFCSLTRCEKSLPSRTHPELCTQENATAGTTPAIDRHKHLMRITL